MHSEFIVVTFDLSISTVVYACVSSIKVTELVPYIDDAIGVIVFGELIVAVLSILIKLGIVGGAIE